MIENIIELPIDQLVVETEKFHKAGYRFVSATCVDNGDETNTITYHFDRDYSFEHLRILVNKKEEVPSVSKVYLCALLVENEMKELFGINITNIAIDYGGHMLLTPEELTSPMGKNQIVIERRGEK